MLIGVQCVSPSSGGRSTMPRRGKARRILRCKLLTSADGDCIRIRRGKGYFGPNKSYYCLFFYLWAYERKSFSPWPIVVFDWKMNEIIRWDMKVENSWVWYAISREPKMADKINFFLELILSWVFTEKPSSTEHYYLWKNSFLNDMVIFSRVTCRFWAKTWTEWDNYLAHSQPVPSGYIYYLLQEIDFIRTSTYYIFVHSPLSRPASQLVIKLLPPFLSSFHWMIKSLLPPSLQSRLIFFTS